MIETLETKKAPEAVGPYSQGVLVKDFIFTSGQLPINVETNQLETEDIEKATRYSLNNLAAILESAGSGMNKVVKVLIFLKDMKDFDRVNNVYKEYFSEQKPARSCVEVSNLPKGAKIEIEAIAIK